MSSLLQPLLVQTDFYAVKDPDPVLPASVHRTPQDPVTLDLFGPYLKKTGYLLLQINPLVRFQANGQFFDEHAFPAFTHESYSMLSLRKKKAVGIARNTHRPPGSPLG